jgi:hypothetical protein
VPRSANHRSLAAGVVIFDLGNEAAPFRKIDNVALRSTAPVKMLTGWPVLTLTYPDGPLHGKAVAAAGWAVPTAIPAITTTPVTS